MHAGPVKTLLFISPVVPDHHGSGRQKRAHQWLYKLKNNYQVKLLIIGQHPEKDLQLGNVTVFYLNPAQPPAEKLQQHFRFILRIFSSSLTGIPRLGWRTPGKNQKAALSRLFQGITFHRIICFRLYLAEFALYLRSISTAQTLELDLDDYESRTRKSLGRLLWSEGKFKAALIQYLSSGLFSRNEAKMVKFFSSFYVCSAEDQQLLIRNQVKVPVHIFPNRIFLPEGQKFNTAPVQQLLFIGTLNYVPNYSGLYWFIRQVMPLISSHFPLLSLKVAGYYPPDALLNEMKNHPAIQYQGAVSDISQFYAQGGIVIAPIFAGGGTKLKVIEGMAHHQPVIATNEAIYGLNGVEEQHFLLANTAREFAAQCTRLFSDPVLYQRIARQGNLLATDYFTYK